MTKQSDNTNSEMQKAKYISPTSWEYENRIYENVDGWIFSRKKSGKSEIEMSQFTHENINDSAFERFLETDEARQQIEEIAKRPRQNKK